MLALLGAAFAVYLLAALIAARWAPSRGQLGMIAGAALLYRLILLPTPPIQEVDIYRYLWDGIVVSQGINPFRFPPHTVGKARLGEVRDPQLAAWCKCATPIRISVRCWHGFTTRSCPASIRR